jgi:amidohydrolase
MAVLNSIAASAPEMREWRRHLHMNPELGLECHGTAAYVVQRLRAFGVDEINEGIGVSGVVALIRGRGEGPVIGLRADMDALPILEKTGAAHASRVEGRMHACGHDGHTTMLLGAAKYLAETRNFAGTVALIFQPGEEGGGGARAMVADGLMERFGIARVFGLHTDPEAELGSFSTRPGPLLAAVDRFDILITGRGGHGAYPETTADPVAAALQIGQALQFIKTRNVAATDPVVVSVTVLEAGSAFNVVPETARLAGTVRTHSETVRDLVEARMAEVCAGLAAALGVKVDLAYLREEGVTVNDPDQTEFSVKVARDVSGADRVFPDILPQMGAEDFSNMLSERPGAFLFLGQGLGPRLHNDRFDFNDDAAPYGASFFARLVETAMPL